MPDNEYKAAGRVLGSQIYVAESADKIVHDVPFSARDIFINSTNGNIYQYDGAEWVYCYTIGAGTIGNVVRYVSSDPEALVFDVNTLVVVTPSGGVPRLTRVATDTFGEKTLETVGLGDGALPYITKAVNDLLNYYNKTEVDDKIAAIHTIEFLVVEELPVTGQSNIIYLVPHTHGVSDLYDEYCWIASQSKYEKIGNTDALVNYYDKDQTDALLATKQNALTFDNEPTAGSNNPVTSEGIKNAIDASASRVYRYKGSLPYYANLPVSGNVIGDVYNIENADPSHGVKAGDNVAWNGLAWDVLSGVVDLTNYYTKPEVDAAVAPKANSADVYTKLEANALLAEKADKATTYTKTETDALLAPKANSADVNADLATKADKATTYTKTETDALLAPKATTADVNAGLALKADKATTYTKTEDDALLAGKADKSTTYTKTEVDTIAATKADGNNVYTKAQSDTLLAGKANGSDVYTKAEVGALLEPKANSADVYSKSETYSKEQVDAIASDKVDKVSGKQLSTEDYTSAEKAKLQGIEAGAQVNDVTSVAGKTGDVTLTKSDVGLGNVENTSDAQKPVSAAQQAALDLKANKSETYTKSETNALLSPKADRAELGTAASKNVGTASGNVPIIGADGKIDPTVMPAIAMSNTYVVSSQADMLALTARVGDVCVRTDENKTYILKETGASTLSHWQELLVPTADILNMLIEPFLTTEAYSKGDYVTYSNVLYRFTADKAAGSWDSTKVETATLNDLIDDVNAAVESVDNKLDKGDYDGSTGVGYSDVSDNWTPYSDESGSEQHEPFVLQGTGCGNGTEQVDTGSYCQLKEKQGNTVVVNQYVNDSSYTFPFTSYGMTVEKANGKYRLHGTSSTPNYSILSFTFHVIAGHKYLTYVNPTGTAQSQSGTWQIYSNSAEDVSHGLTRYQIEGPIIQECTSSGSEIVSVAVYGDEIDVSFNCYIIDLTQWFGSNDKIPSDLLSHPENFFRYYQGSLAYNAGTLTNSNGQVVKTIGRNIWNEETVLNNGVLKTKDPIRVTPRSEYYINHGEWQNLYALDKDGNPIGGVPYRSSGSGWIITIPAYCIFITFEFTSSYGTAYKHDTTISLYYSGESGYDQYYPYEVLDEVDTGSEDLRSAGSAHDVKKPSGEITRNVNKYTFTGSETWNAVGSAYYCSAISSLVKPASSNAAKANILFPTLDNETTSDLVNNVKTTGISISDGGFIIIGSADYANISSLTGKSLNYELATPTTEQGTPFPETVKIDDFGTMQIETQSGTTFNGVPMGNKIFYPVDYKAFTDTLYNHVGGDGNNVLPMKGESEALPENHPETLKQLLDYVDGLHAIEQENIGGALRHQLAESANIDFANTDYDDLDSFNWNYNSEYGVFYGSISGAKDSGKCISSIYKYASNVYEVNMSCSIGTSGFFQDCIIIKNTSYTDATAFKAAMKGILMAYEKA